MKQAKKDQQAMIETEQAQEDEATDVGQDDEDEQPFNEIDQLQEHGINMADINKLK